MQKLKALFTNDDFFLVAIILGFGGYMAKSSFGLFGMVEGYNFQIGILYILLAVCLLVLYVSYVKHSKNVMKGMMGALFMGLLATAVYWMNGETETYVLILTIVEFVLEIGLFVNHFIINADHHSKPINITINQIIVTLLTIDALVWCVIWIAGSPTSETAMAALVDLVAAIGLYATLICVESRLDAYRINREEAGWTEAKGYPKGYDRTKNYEEK